VSTTTEPWGDTAFPGGPARPAPYPALGPVALIAAGIAVLTTVPILATFRAPARRE
jgi:hypothetical protein